MFIPDPGSGFFFIPDPWDKKHRIQDPVPDPSATPVGTVAYELFDFIYEIF
jgi:hypothetical protein